MLVGTTSVEKSEMLSNMLKRKYGIEHEVLNAKHHEREAQIVAVAGQQHKNAHGEMVGNVTIATNMAGRGTDIKLSAANDGGGRVARHRHRAAHGAANRQPASRPRRPPGRSGLQPLLRLPPGRTDEDVRRRVDDQSPRLARHGRGHGHRGQAHQQGHPPRQKKVEERNFLARKNLLEYDEVMDHQRTAFYGMRQSVLLGQGIDAIIWDMIGEAIADAVDKYITAGLRRGHDRRMGAGQFRHHASSRTICTASATSTSWKHYIKDQARAEAETNITATLGEFMGEDAKTTRANGTPRACKAGR